MFMLLFKDRSGRRTSGDTACFYDRPLIPPLSVLLRETHVSHRTHAILITDDRNRRDNVNCRRSFVRERGEASLIREPRSPITDKPY